MRNLIDKRIQSNLFPKILGPFFPIFGKVQEDLPHWPPLVARLKMQEGNVEVNLVANDLYVFAAKRKKPQSGKWLRLLSNGENKTDPNQLFAFPRKICKNVRLISNDGKHMRNIENGVDSLQLFSFTQEAGIRIALHASKYRANVEVVLKYLVVSRSRYQRNGCWNITKAVMLICVQYTCSIWRALSVEIYYNIFRSK